MILKGVIYSMLIALFDQLADIFTKPLNFLKMDHGIILDLKDNYLSN